MAAPYAVAESVDLEFETPAEFRGAWNWTAPSVGYLLGTKLVQVEAQAAAANLTILETGIAYLDTMVVNGPLPPVHREVEQYQFQNLSLKLSDCQAWGIALHNGTTTGMLDGKLRVEDAVTESWHAPLGHVAPHPLVRELPATPDSALVLTSQGTGEWGLSGAFTIELYGLCGVADSSRERLDLHSGQVEHQEVSDVGWGAVHRYIRVEIWNGELSLHGQAISRMAAPLLDLAGSGSIVLPNARLPQAAASQGATLPNGTWQGHGTFELQALEPVQRGQVTGQYAGAFDELRVDGEPFVEEAAQVAAVSVGVAVLFVLLKYVYTAAFFTRLSPQEALEHPRRQSLHRYIQEHPGATFRELCRATDIPAGTCRHHLSVLDRAQVIVEHRHRATVRFFENHGKFDQKWQEVVMLREPELAKIHGWLKEHEGSIQKDILEHALSSWGWSRSTTQHRLQRLVDNGLVDVQEMGRRKSYSLAHNESEPVRQFGLRV